MEAEAADEEQRQQRQQGGDDATRVKPEPAAEEVSEAEFGDGGDGDGDGADEEGEEEEEESSGTEARRNAAIKELEDAAAAESDPDFDPLQEEPARRTRPSNKLIKFSRVTHRPRLLASPGEMKNARVVLEDIDEMLDTDSRFQGPEGGEDGDEAEAAAKCVVEGCTSEGPSKSFFFFPSRDPVQLEKWAEVVKNGKPFKPARWDRVCEDHFYLAKPSPTNIHPDYVPSILPWNDNHRPETEEEKKEFYRMMAEKKKQIRAIIEKKYQTLSKGRVRGPRQTTGAPLKRGPGRPRLIKRLKQELSDDEDEDELARVPVSRTQISSSAATAPQSKRGGRGGVANRVRAVSAQANASALTNLKAEVARQKTLIENLRKVHAGVQDELKDERKKRKVAEIRCKFLEDKNRGLFERCKEYAAGKTPEGPLPPVPVVREIRAAPGTMKSRGTQFRERDYADPNAEMSEDEVTPFNPSSSSSKGKKRKRARRPRGVLPAADSDSDGAGEDEENVAGETDPEEDRSPSKRARAEPKPKLPNVPRAIKKNLQPVALTDVPAGVKKAFQNVLKEKQKLQPIPSAAVPMAVQKAVQQRAAAKPPQLPQRATFPAQVQQQDLQTVTEVVVEDLSGVATAGTSATAVSLPLAQIPQQQQQQILVSSASATAGDFNGVPATILTVPAELLEASGQQRTVVFQQKP